MGHDKPTAITAIESWDAPRLEELPLYEWRAAVAARLKAEKEKPLHDAMQAQRDRALGLAWIDPGHLDEYAIAAGIPPKTLREALSADEGERVAIAMAARLRSSGEAARVQGARLQEKLLAMIERGVDEDEVSVTTAPKMLDALSKLIRLADSRGAQAETLVSVFVGDAKELLGHG